VQGAGFRVREKIKKMEKPLKNFKDLRVWQEAYALTLLVYKVTKKFPKEELYGIVSQMRRASVSVVSNIAEGYSRKGRMEYIQFLSIAYGSLAELETQILLSRDLQYFTETEYKELLNAKERVAPMLYKLIQALNSAPRTRQPISRTRHPEPCTLDTHED